MKNIRLSEIQPEIKGAREFSNTARQYRYEYNKRSYTHRLMCIADGSCSFHYADRHFRCEIGDIVYFPPNQPYGNEFSGRDFRVFNLFFDFYPYRGESDVYSSPCLEGEHRQEFMGESVHFSDCAFFNTLQRISAFPGALDRTAAICREYNERRICSKQRSDAMLTDLLISLYRFSESVVEVRDGRSTDDILEYINRNCRLPLTGQDLSARFNYHPNYINKLVQKATSMTLHAYILDTKIRRAAVLLRETNMSITEIALWFSFYDSSHFSNVFRRITGFTPHEYRRATKNGEAGKTYL